MSFSGRGNPGFHKCDKMLSLTEHTEFTEKTGNSGKSSSAIVKALIFHQGTEKGGERLQAGFRRICHKGGMFYH